LLPINIPLPYNEAERLDALRRYNILDTEPESAFNDIARLAAICCQTPIALVNFADAHRVWSKARINFPYPELPRELTACTHAILENDLCIVPDALLDRRFATNPLVTTPPGLRFYAGVPLITPEGYAIGTLCVMDLKPRELTVEQQEALRALARQTTNQLELRRSVIELQLEVAERQAAKEALHKSQQALSLFVEQTFFAVINLDIQFRITDWNPAAEKIFGFARAEALGHHPVGLITDPQLAEGMEKVWQHVLQAKQPLRGRNENLTRDGRILICEWYLTPLIDTHDDVIGVMAIAQEVTEAVRADQALQESERRFRVLFEASPVGICIARNEILLYANPAAQAMFGYNDTSEGIGQSFFKFFAPESHALLIERMSQRESKNLLSFAYEAIGKRKDGSLFPVHIETSEVGLQDGPAVIGFITDITESQQAKAELENSLALLRATLDSTADGLLVVDLEGRIVSFNQKFVTMWHMPAAILATRDDAQALGYVLEQLKTPDNFLAKVRELYNQPDAESFDELEFKDERIFERYSQPVRLNGKSVGRVWSFRDVTESRRTQAAQARLAAILHATPDFVGMVDMQGKPIFVNQAGLQLLGRSADFDITTTNMRDWVPSATIDQLVRKALPYALRHGQWVGEMSLADAQGREIPVSQVIIAHKNARGKLEYFSTVARDLSERKHAEEALRQSEALLRGIIDNTTAVIFVKQLDGRYLLVNQQWEKLHNFTLEQIRNKTNYEIFPAKRADFFRACDQAVLDTGEVLDFEDRTTFADGEHVFINTRFALYDHAGQPYAICGIATDVTERIQLEEQLRHSQKMEAIGRLAGGVAHDFNNILMAIYGSCALAQMRMAKDDPARRYIDEIQKAGERAAALTHQLLAFSRKQVVQAKTLDLNEMLASMEELLKRLVGEHIQIKLHIEPGLGYIKVDPSQMEQVILNLVANARDAMPSGGQLAITTHNISHLATPVAASYQPPTHILLRVEDTGHGMDPETLEHIFEPFFTTKAQGKGTGLGLATVYGIVKQSGGEIQVASQAGQGTTITILLPRVSEAPKGKEPISSGVPLLRGSERVLLVEDEEMVRRTTREMLEANGYQVLEAAGPSDALRLHTQAAEPITLLLTDVVMPGMGGRELADQLLKAQPTLKVLFMSGHTDDAVVAHGVRHDRMAFLQKPFTLDLLLNKLRAVLDVE
jgi:PAS domain S-box-containing protein